MPGQRQDLYADPSHYDILNTPGTAAEVDAIERIERRYAAGPLRTDRLWFEPACGTGRYLRVAAGRGRRVAGFDLDPGMIRYARASRKLARARLFTAEMTDFADQAGRAGIEPGSVDLALNPVNSLRLLTTDTAVVAHLDQVARTLKPGGLYVVGISLTDYDNLDFEEDLWEGARGGCRVSQLANYLPPEPGTRRGRTETVISHLMVSRPRGEEHFDDRYDLHCFDEKQWRRVVGRSALHRLATREALGKTGHWFGMPYQLEVLKS